MRVIGVICSWLWFELDDRWFISRHAQKEDLDAGCNVYAAIGFCGTYWYLDCHA